MPDTIKRSDSKIYMGDEQCPYASISFEIRDGVIEIFHTIVDSEYSGQGIASRLMKKMIEIARAEGYKINPIRCWYANGYMEKHPDTGDVLIGS